MQLTLFDKRKNRYEKTKLYHEYNINEKINFKCNQFINTIYVNKYWYYNTPVQIRETKMLLKRYWVHYKIRHNVKKKGGI